MSRSLTGRRGHDGLDHGRRLRSAKWPTNAAAATAASATVGHALDVSLNLVSAREASTPPRDRSDSSDERDSHDRADPHEIADPTENTDPAEPMLPIDAIEPVLPIESTEPFEAIDKNESVDHNERREESLMRPVNGISRAFPSRFRRATTQPGPVGSRA